VGLQMHLEQELLDGRLAVAPWQTWQQFRDQ
jgi:hypothetical protein